MCYPFFNQLLQWKGSENIPTQIKSKFLLSVHLRLWLEFGLKMSEQPDMWNSFVV